MQPYLTFSRQRVSWNSLSLDEKLNLIGDDGAILKGLLLRNAAKVKETAQQDAQVRDVIMQAAEGL